MSTYRQYLEEFEVSCPYDINNDVLSKTSHAKDIAMHVGAVVFNRSSVDKPHKPVYLACAQFINKLKGSVLVVGDVNGGVLIKLEAGRSFKVLPVEACWPPGAYEWMGDKAGYMLEWDKVSSHLDQKHYDHIVHLFKGERKESVVVKGSKEHFLDFAEGLHMSRVEGKFMYKGKSLSVFPHHGDHSVMHTVLFPGGHDGILYNIIWWTVECPVKFSSSMIPLSPGIGIGVPSSLMVSEKKDGVPVLMTIKDFEIILVEEGKEIARCSTVKSYREVCLCERIGKMIYVLEPVYSDCGVFSDWVDTKTRRQSFEVPGYSVAYKEWFGVTPQQVRTFLTGNSEGACFKRRFDVIGLMDPVYRKVSTYYVKNPTRASYEDYVYHSNAQHVLQGMHSLYGDPKGVYVGEGVYEVSAFTPKSLIRWRDKSQADPAWYVDAVQTPFKYVDFLVKVDKMMYEVAQDGEGGLVHLMRAERTIAKDKSVVQEGKNIRYRSGFHFPRGHRISALGMNWRVSIKKLVEGVDGVYDYYCVKDNR